MTVSKSATFIHTFESGDELERLLASIEKNATFSKQTTYVLDDSIKLAARGRNKELVDRSGIDSIRYFDRDSWQTYFNDRVISTISGPLKEFASSIQLGEDGWNVHNARNVGQLLSILEGVDFAFNLDQDIIIPPLASVSEFSFESTVACAQIEGGPDLSRMNWINFYLMGLQAEAGLEIDEADNFEYCNSLLNSLGPNRCAEVISKYSEFSLSFEPSCNSGEQIPHREEFYGACYLVEAVSGSATPFPPWFDNDWFYFRSLRTTPRPDFLSLVVEHASRRKKVLSDSWILPEELGHFLTLLGLEADSEGRFSSDVFDEIYETRIGHYENNLRIVAQLEESGFESSQLQGAKSILLKVLDEVPKISAQRYEKEIRTYRSYQESWSQLLEVVKS